MRERHIAQERGTLHEREAHCTRERCEFCRSRCRIIGDFYDICEALWDYQDKVFSMKSVIFKNKDYPHLSSFFFIFYLTKIFGLETMYKSQIREL